MRSNHDITFDMVSEMELLVKLDLEEYRSLHTVEEYIEQVMIMGGATLSYAEFNTVMVMRTVNQRAAFEILAHNYIDKGDFCNMCYLHELREEVAAVTGNAYGFGETWVDYVNFLTDAFMCVIDMWRDNDINIEDR